MTRGRVALIGGVGIVLVLAASTQTWLTGTTSDAVLGRSTVTADGAEAAPGLLALAFVVVAALVAAMITRGWVRRSLVVVALLAALGAAVVAALAVADPERILGPLAATRAARTGTIPVSGSVLPWAWVGLAGAIVLGVATGLALLGVRHWPTPSTKYDAPEGVGTVTGPRGERVGSAWDRLSAGEDPTDMPSSGTT